MLSILKVSFRRFHHGIRFYIGHVYFNNLRLGINQALTRMRDPDSIEALKLELTQSAAYIDNMARMAMAAMLQVGVLILSSPDSDKTYKVLQHPFTHSFALPVRVLSMVFLSRSM